MSKLLLRHIYKIYPGVAKSKKNAKGEGKREAEISLLLKILIWK